MPPAIDFPDELLTREQLAKWLGVSARHIADELHHATPPLPHMRIARRLRYSKRQVGAWLYFNQQQVDPIDVDLARARKQLGRGNK